ncbi:hypothetical protein F4780DRAFT_782602 [Xylariomycetidae sp. FL0641]|nr:hypothetical protein F4780DRAFT_782602 [Xylariomycetidae sp. FL0641]
MHYPWNIVAIVCFAVLSVAIIALLYILLYIQVRPRRSSRNTEGRGFQVPTSVQQALTQLENVTEKRRYQDLQSTMRDADCPICLSPFWPRGDERPGPANLEAGIAITETSRTTIVRATTEAKPSKAKALLAAIPRLPGTRRPREPTEEEVLKMKRCTHMFHARCLANWFMKEKFDCPVCRTTYYQRPSELEPDVDYREVVTMPALPYW